MRYDDTPPTLRVKRKNGEGGPDPVGLSPLISQMCTATIASMRATVRGLKDRDTAALVQAARNGQIVEELFFQENESISGQSTERQLLNLSKWLSEAATLAVNARISESKDMDDILAQLLPYLESIMDDITPSPIRRFMPATSAPPSRKKLPTMKEAVIEAMARSNDPETIRSGISLFRLIEIIDATIPVAIRIGAALSR